MTATWLAIVNPCAGYLRSPRWQRSFAETLRRRLDAEVIFTRHRGHATELAANSTAGNLAVFGGDGTIAEVVNGMDLGRQRLLLLAGGTGNGLARDLGLTSPEASFRAAQAGHVRSLDIIRVTFREQARARTRLAISTASIGYAAEVVVLANRYFKSLGSLCYPLAATLQAMRQLAFGLQVSLEDGPLVERRLSNVMVNNTRHAGNFGAFRGSDLSDGCLEVLLARAGFARQCLHNLAVLSKTYFYRTAPEIAARKVRAVLLTPQRLMIDGEIWDGVTEAQFEALPGRLHCLV